MKKALRISRSRVFALFFGFPLYWVITMAFKPKVEENPPGIVVWHPENPTLNELQGRPRHQQRRRQHLRVQGLLRAHAAQEQLPRGRRRDAARAAGGRLRGLRDRALPRRRLAAAVPDPAAAHVPSGGGRDPALLHVRLPAPLEHAGGADHHLRGGHVPVRRVADAELLPGRPARDIRGRDRRRLHAVGGVLQGRAATGQGRPRGDRAVRLHPQLVRLPDRARDDAGQVDDRAALPEHDERRLGRAGVRPPGGARRPADPAARRSSGSRSRSTSSAASPSARSSGRRCPRSRSRPSPSTSETLQAPSTISSSRFRTDRSPRCSGPRAAARRRR